MQDSFDLYPAVAGRWARRSSDKIQAIGHEFGRVTEEIEAKVGREAEILFDGKDDCCSHLFGKWGWKEVGSELDKLELLTAIHHAPIGVAVYDDNVVRPQYAQGRWTGGPPYDTVAWSESDQVLTAASSNTSGGGPLYELQVNSSGPALQATGAASFNLGTMHSDFGTGLIYSDDGNVADPNTLATVGSYGASGLFVPDSSLNRAFILGQLGYQAGTHNFTVQSFDEKAYTAVSSLRLDNLLGTPIAFVRWGTSGLAVLTMNAGTGPFGMLYLVQDSSFVTNAQIAASRMSKPQELVQRRWKPISKADIVKMIHKRTAAKSSEPAEVSVRGSGGCADSALSEHEGID